MNYRSCLFVPGDRPERFDKALASGAGCVILDLEDAVSPERKALARDCVNDWLDERHPVVLRVNAAATEWFEDDLRLAAHPGVAALMLPKAETAASLVRVGTARAKLPVMALMESAAGFAALDEVAGAPGVACLVFGSIDLQAELGMRDPLYDDLLYFRSRLVLASRLAGIAAPIDGVCTAIDDLGQLTSEARHARRLGFAGKLCIHPRQVAPVDAAFRPGAAELDWARRVVEASAAAGGAAVRVDGKMVDKPVLLLAEALLRDSAG